MHFLNCWAPSASSIAYEPVLYTCRFGDLQLVTVQSTCIFFMVWSSTTVPWESFCGYEIHCNLSVVLSFERKTCWPKTSCSLAWRRHNCKVTLLSRADFPDKLQFVGAAARSHTKEIWKRTNETSLSYQEPSSHREYRETTENRETTTFYSRVACLLRETTWMDRLSTAWINLLELVKDRSAAWSWRSCSQQTKMRFRDW